MKMSYKVAISKREVQEKIYKSVKNDTIVTMCGPSINDCCNVIKKCGFKTIISYENNRNVFLKQLIDNNSNLSIRFGNILDNINDGCFYDFDFCFSIYSISTFLPLLKKLKCFSITLSLRPAGKYKTISIMKSIFPKLSYYVYKDTSSMITFLINN